MKGQSNLEIARTPRNAFRCSLGFSTVEVERPIGCEGFTAYQVLTNSECHGMMPGGDPPAGLLRIGQARGSRLHSAVPFRRDPHLRRSCGSQNTARRAAMQHLGIENPIENLTVSEYAIIPLQMSLEEMSLQTQYYEVKYGDFDVKIRHC